LAERLEIALYRGAAGVTGQSTEIIQSVRERCWCVATEVVTNGVEPARFGPQMAEPWARELIGAEPGPVFIFAGLLGLAQGLDQILDLVKSLPADIPGRIVLVGDGPAREHLQRRIRDELIPRLKLLPAQARDRIPALLGAADVAVISLGMLIPGAVPSKIYEAMAAELPILLVADGEPARRVHQARCGLSVPPGDISALRDAFCRLASDARFRSELGAAGRRAAETVYHRDVIARQLDRFLRGMLSHEVAR
jgi:glycosyltransferase involved in cell wall biosynthesis